jgi:hypothetical protein
MVKAFAESMKSQCSHFQLWSRHENSKLVRAPSISFTRRLIQAPPLLLTLKIKIVIYLCTLSHVTNAVRPKIDWKRREGNKASNYNLHPIAPKIRVESHSSSPHSSNHQDCPFPPRLEKVRTSFNPPTIRPAEMTFRVLQSHHIQRATCLNAAG